MEFKIAPTRQQIFSEHFPDAPKFRWKQIEQALFQSRVRGWDDVSSLPKEARSVLNDNASWITLEEKKIFISKNKDTHKAVLKTYDGLFIETVLMENKRGHWTICVSSQVGCAMGCTFCATGTMGLKRSLSSDEIIDQYRFWMYFLADNFKTPEMISNVVFMGMGEPLMNYDAVKKTIQNWLQYTEIGKTHITVSTVGVIPVMEKILTDPEWPDVRIAISLHSPNALKRKEIVPTTIPGFHDTLADWAKRYAKTYPSRKNHITYEYTLLNEVNDTPQNAHELAKYILTTGVSKINVIPYNPVSGKVFTRTQQDRIDIFKDIVLHYGITITQRRTMGDDIGAACGQLVTLGV